VGRNNSTAGVYAACVKLREAVTQKLGFNIGRRRLRRRRGAVRQPQRVAREARPADGELIAEDTSNSVTSTRTHQQSTFGAHFVEVGVDAATARRGSDACWPSARPGASSIQRSARSQVIGAMTMGVGAR
jgi:xanthine dehydrogenase YagR molybdenum-binding subunit